MDLLNSLQPPIAEGWSVCCNTEGCSPLGIPWNECPLWRTKLGTNASESCRILVVADPDLVNSPISLWAANKGSEPSEPKSLDSFCWYVNNVPRLLEANLQSIMFDLLRGKIKKKLTHLSSPGAGVSEIGFSAPPRDLADFTFPGKLKSAIGQYSRDAHTLGLIIEETKSKYHPILESLDFLNYSPWPLDETMRQVHLTAASFSALLYRAPPKSLSDSLSGTPLDSDSTTHVAKLTELAKLLSLNFAHLVEGWVITLCCNSSMPGENQGAWHTFPSMLGTFISSSRKILVALDPVTPKRIVRVWEAHRPDIAISNPNIMEYRWHNPSDAAEQPKIFNEIAVALGFGASLQSAGRLSATHSPGSLTRASRSPSPSPPRGWGAIPLSSILRDYRRHVFNVIETYADDKQSLHLLMEEALKPQG